MNTSDFRENIRLWRDRVMTDPRTKVPASTRTLAYLISAKASPTNPSPQIGQGKLQEASGYGATAVKEGIKRLSELGYHRVKAHRWNPTKRPNNRYILDLCPAKGDNLEREDFRADFFNYSRERDHSDYSRERDHSDYSRERDYNSQREEGSLSATSAPAPVARSPELEGFQNILDYALSVSKAGNAPPDSLLALWNNKVDQGASPAAMLIDYKRHMAACLADKASSYTGHILAKFLKLYDPVHGLPRSRRPAGSNSSPLAPSTAQEANGADPAPGHSSVASTVLSRLGWSLDDLESYYLERFPDGDIESRERFIRTAACFAIMVGYPDYDFDLTLARSSDYENQDLRSLYRGYNWPETFALFEVAEERRGAN